MTAGFRSRLPRGRGSSLPAARCLAVFAAVLSILLGPASPPACAADLHLADEQEIYIVLDKLNAMGMLPGFLANTRPYDMQAVREAAGNVQWSGLAVPESVSEFGNWVAYRSSPTAMARVQLSTAYSRYRKVEENNGGIPTPDGYSARVSAIGRYEPRSWFSADGKALAWIGEKDDQGSRAREYSVQVGHKYFSLQAGEITTWYGPGRRGSIIFTNNAEPYPGVRIHNPVPIPITGFFSFLGHFQYDLFFAQMDEDRPVPETTLSGMRLAFRPNRYLEIGVSRAMHFNGDGQGNWARDWWDAFTGAEDRIPNERNQLGGFDVELTLPFKFQPVQLYLEMAGEDQSRGEGIEVIPLPEKWSLLAGAFFPAILGSPALDFRVEYADNHFYDEGEIWYNSSFSPHRYKGRILGHPMGTDARDLLLQGRWFFLPSTYLECTVNFTDRFLPGPSAEKTTGFRLAFSGWFTRSVRAGAGFLAERVQNAGGVADIDRDGFAAWVDVAWQFSGGNAHPSSKERP